MSWKRQTLGHKQTPSRNGQGGSRDRSLTLNYSLLLSVAGTHPPRGQMHGALETCLVHRSSLQSHRGQVSTETPACNGTGSHQS